MKGTTVLKGMKNYFVDTTGIFLASTPFFAGLEVFAFGMPVSTSLESRLKVIQFGYLGMGILYTKGRDLCQDFFKVDEKSLGKKTFYDSIYNVSFNMAVSVPIYLSSGASIEQTIKGSIGVSLLGLVTGPINGYCIDTFRDLVGTKEFLRLPESIRNIKSKGKKVIATSLVIASVGMTAGVYKIKEATVIDDSVKSQIKFKNRDDVICDTPLFYRA